MMDTASGVCGHGRCEVQAAQFRKDFMKKGLGGGLVSPGRPPVPVMVVNQCAVCGKEDTKACSRCKVTAYCGKSCQIADWPRHKAQCKARSQVG